MTPAGDRGKGGPLEPLIELDARGRLDRRAGRLANLFRQARSARPLDDMALVRVRARLRSGHRQGLAHRRRTPMMAVGVALLALAGGAIAGLGMRSSREVDVTAARPTPTPTPTVVPPTDDDDAPAATRRNGARRRSLSPSAAPGSAAPVRSPSGPLAEETRLLERALTSLRRDRDGAAALAVLDRYQSRFPAGLLRPEAARARVDALFLLDRTREAGAALDTLTLAPRGRDLELLLVRAELRGQRDCSAAVADFDRVLGAVTSGALAERALYGLAVCRAEQGDGPGARRAFQDYLRRFPTGRFAAAAERGLRR